MAISTSPATGARGMIHIGEETEYGVPVQPTHLIVFNSEGIAASENVIESEAIRADRGRHKLIRGNLDIQGDISYEQSAEGYGMLLRHALGDYLKLPTTDGGVHARLNRNAEVDVDGTAACLTLADDHSGGFSPSGGLFCVAYRDSDNVLQLDDNAGAGYAYTSAASKVRSYVDGFATPTVTIAQVYGPDGTAIDPEFAADGGVIQIGQDRREYRYTAPNQTGSGTELTLDAADLTANGDPVANEAAISLGCVSNAATMGVSAAALKNGAFIYDFDPVNYAGVITHHLERGRYLPVGLTVEVDRDAAIFLYSGLKVNTLTVNFETNAIVTSTISLVGKSEDAMAVLDADIVPGATSITVKKAEAFPAAGTLTIGERTGITYTGKTTDPNTGITTFTGLVGVDRAALKGANVDCRTSRAVANPVVGNASPLTAFDTVIYVDGYYEEVLSGSLTLNNNLNTDKYGLGSRMRLQLVEQQATVEASLQLEFDDGKFYKRFKESDYFSLEFKCISEADDSIIGNTGIPCQAYYFMPKCKFNGNTPLIEGTSYITHEMPVTCVVDDEGATTDLVIILVNGLDEDVEL